MLFSSLAWSASPPVVQPSNVVNQQDFLTISRSSTQPPVPSQQTSSEQVKVLDQPSAMLPRSILEKPRSPTVATVQQPTLSIGDRSASVPALNQSSQSRNAAGLVSPRPQSLPDAGIEFSPTSQPFSGADSAPPPTVQDKADYIQQRAATDLDGWYSQSPSQSNPQSKSSTTPVGHDTTTLTQAECDPELGCVRLQDPSTQIDCDPELGCVRVQESPTQPSCDPELGCVRIQPPPPVPVRPRRAPVVYLLGRLDYFRSGNVLSGVDPVDDGLFRPGLTLYAAPPIGRNTFLVGSIDGNLIRYSEQSKINYDELRFRAGILQRLSPVMYGEIGWSNQQLFTSSDDLPGTPQGTRFLNDHAIRLDLSRRDRLAPRLNLSTFYQFRLSFADPDDRSRVINALIASLSYDAQPNLQVALDYQFALANFTRVDREDQYHQILGRLTYSAVRNTQFNLFAGYSFGRSTEPSVDFDGFLFGVSLTFTLGLF